MRGQKLIKKIDQELLQEISTEYRRLVLKEKIKKDLITVGEISGKILLAAGVLAGILVVGAIAPNIIGAIGKLTKGKRRKVYFNCKSTQFNQSLSYLKKQRIVGVSQGRGGREITLTKRGRQRFYIHLVENIAIPKPKKWDGQWRIVIFDVLEKFKVGREALREKLYNLGFRQIQKSIFVFPYPCEKEVNFVREIFGLSNQVRLIQASHFEGEEEVKEYFNLS